MIFIAQRLGSAAALALVLLGLLSGSGAQESVGMFAQGQPDCSMIVKPGESIQSAIKNASRGAIICLEEGTWSEWVGILYKELTIRGAGANKTILDGSRLDRWKYGFWIEGSVVQIEGVTIRHFGRYGIYAYGLGLAAKVTVQNSKISSNGDGGVFVQNAQVTIKNSIIQKNGSHLACFADTGICNGITIEGFGNPRITIMNSLIVENTDWGISAWLRKCGYKHKIFDGQVIFEGMNLIEGNNQSGNQNGMGNPGNHPWNRPEVPDGQVCLP